MIIEPNDSLCTTLSFGSTNKIAVWHQCADRLPRNFLKRDWFLCRFNSRLRCVGSGASAGEQPIEEGKRLTPRLPRNRNRNMCLGPVSPQRIFLLHAIVFFLTPLLILL